MIRNVVFDVGNVLVKLHYQPFIGYLVKSGVDMSDLPSWLKSVDLEGHERGDVPGEILLGSHRGPGRAPAGPGRTARATGSRCSSRGTKCSRSRRD